jgi:hypothetical protein
MRCWRRCLRSGEPTGLPICEFPSSNVMVFRVHDMRFRKIQPRLNTTVVTDFTARICAHKLSIGYDSCPLNVRSVSIPTGSDRRIIMVTRLCAKCMRRRASPIRENTCVSLHSQPMIGTMNSVPAPVVGSIDYQVPELLKINRHSLTNLTQPSAPPARPYSVSPCRAIRCGRS